MAHARYKTIVDGFASRIRDGRLPPGTRLPTHRDLAREHGVALATATRVYAELAGAGLVVGEPGRGTFVRDQSGYAGAEPPRVPREHRVADLSFGRPLSPGQDSDLRAALRRLAAAGDAGSLLLQPPPGGRAADRAAVATHLLGAGIDAAPDEVLLTAGAQHGLDSAVRALTRPGEVVAVDESTYPGVKLTAGLHGVELAPVPHTPSGMDTGALDALCRRRSVAAVYTMPTVHNPLGTVMDGERRLALAALVRRHGLVLVEDGTHAFLDPGAPPPVRSLAPGRTVYLASLSKNLATGLRFGALVAPSALRGRLTRALRASTWGVPPLVAALAAGWLRDGTVERLEQERRSRARRRQRLAARALTGLDYRAHPGSDFGWLRLPREPRPATVARDLAGRGVLVSTEEAFAVGPHPAPALRLSLSSPASSAELERALKEVRAVLPE
ncbi:DNA-binding transcriptional regulator, MocR family, contains an aminotransferase domain [Nocardiopsis flavescens]|uniref:DNA-binding transcriptional regulator, MocR family, contains an aminotransferase domain n=1 Tax=Nocardiopsis flavescens TaxID=758803 RepID=A0A1M6US58_9ACTN|nr:PLP-dependent aminotransferase family protein [Nocardiopsis flavescens]SHK71994.1 DNA-binding transcriptional regulator, MocR family, contains an aminotransferase domain [Nocardiopsis flavescens]